VLNPNDELFRTLILLVNVEVAVLSYMALLRDIGQRLTYAMATLT